MKETLHRKTFTKRAFVHFNVNVLPIKNYYPLNLHNNVSILNLLPEIVTKQ